MDDKRHDFPVSSTDDVGAVTTEPPRDLEEFKPTNSPLSAADLKYQRDRPRKKRKQGWVPRTTENIGELTPIPEEGAPKK